MRKKEKMSDYGFGAERFVASLLALTSFGSYNRCISNFANAPSKFLASLGTSDMPRLFYEIPSLSFKKKIMPQRDK